MTEILAARAPTRRPARRSGRGGLARRRLERDPGRRPGEPRRRAEAPAPLVPVDIVLASERLVVDPGSGSPGHDPKDRLTYQGPDR